MTATLHPPVIVHENQEFVHPEARTELARHSVDLRIHALIMVGSALFAAYCGLGIAGAYGDGPSDDRLPMIVQSDVLSLGACVAFIAIALACLIEAHRFWSKAAVIRSRIGRDAGSNRAVVQIPSPTKRETSAIIGRVSSPFQALKQA